MNNDENKPEESDWSNEENCNVSTQPEILGVLSVPEYADEREQIQRLFEHFLNDVRQREKECITRQNFISMVSKLARLNSSAFLMLIAICSVCCNITWMWRSSHTEATIGAILKTKGNDCKGCPMVKPADCFDILRMGHSASGVYEIWPLMKLKQGRSLNVYCDMHTDGGGWTVFQRRGDFQSPKDHFFQNWENYKNGFGNITTDFWLGNDNIFALTSQRTYSARFDLEDFDQNKRYAFYQEFYIDDETNKYTLHISGYSGNAGDSMIAAHNNAKFSTKDQDNDQCDRNVAATYKGAWWYRDSGHQSNLNGLYHWGKHNTYGDGINWHSWKGFGDSMKWTEIKIRPEYLRLLYTSQVPSS